MASRGKCLAYYGVLYSKNSSLKELASPLSKAVNSECLTRWPFATVDTHWFLKGFVTSVRKNMKQPKKVGIASNNVRVRKTINNCIKNKKESEKKNKQQTKKTRNSWIIYKNIYFTIL